MRLYSFVNYYLSPLQHGLQTAHCVSEMANQVANEKGENLEAYRKYFDWAENHKTIIICNGGNQAMLEDLFTRLISTSMLFNLALVKFYEDEQSLGGALTSVALLVPVEFYDVTFVPSASSKFSMGAATPAAYVHEPEFLPGLRFEEGSTEFEFIALLKSFRLA
jgi:hypothetical protein